MPVVSTCSDSLSFPTLAYKKTATPVVVSSTLTMVTQTLSKL